MREILKQPQFHPMSVPEQIAVLVAVNEGVLDEVPVAEITAAERPIRRAAVESLPDLCKPINVGERFAQEDLLALNDCARKVLQKEGLKGHDSRKPSKEEK